MHRKMWLCFLFGAWASRQGGRAVVNGATSIPLRSIPASPPLRASIPDAECLGALPPSPPARGTSPLATPGKRKNQLTAIPPLHQGAAPLHQGAAPLRPRGSGRKPKTGADLPPPFHAARLRRSFVARQTTRVPEERKHGADLSTVSLKDGAGDLLHSAALHSEELPHPSKRPAHHPQRAAPLATPERGKNGLPAADLPSVLRRASSPQPTSSSAPSGHDRRRPAAFLRLCSVRTEARLFSGSFVLLKPGTRSRRAARAGIASMADRPTPPATTRGAALCIPECLGALPPSPPAKELHPSALPFLRGRCPHTPALAARQEGRGLPSAEKAFGAREPVKAEPPAAVAGASLDRQQHTRRKEK